MKKFIKAMVIIVLLVCVLVPVEHFWGDNIYGLFAFAKSDVVEIEKNTYKTPKDDAEVFIDYMEKDGWELYDQGGSTYFLKKGDRLASCSVDYKEFYSIWTVDYDS